MSKRVYDEAVERAIEMHKAGDENEWSKAVYAMWEDLQAQRLQLRAIVRSLQNLATSVLELDK